MLDKLFASYNILLLVLWGFNSYSQGAAPTQAQSAAAFGGGRSEMFDAETHTHLTGWSGRGETPGMGPCCR